MNDSNSVELMQVIRTTLTLRGDGTPEDPYRRIVQYWSTDGELLAEGDRYIINQPNQPQ
jgi:hypothetical protein